MAMMHPKIFAESMAAITGLEIEEIGPARAREIAKAGEVHIDYRPTAEVAKQAKTSLRTVLRAARENITEGRGPVAERARAALKRGKLPASSPPPPGMVDLLCEVLALELKEKGDFLTPRPRNWGVIERCLLDHLRR